MIDFDQVTITYPDAPAPTLRDLSLHLPEGELTLVMGSTGSGKSTFLRAINGLVPHFSGGHLKGRVVVGGRDTATHPPRELADLIGYVGQDPVAGFVTDNVEHELAYGMESLGLTPATMRRRVEETLDLLGLAELRHRPLTQLSGGQQQRVAIGAVLTTHPQVLVLDEPTSALDPLAAEDVLAAVQRLVHDLGLTVVMAEHRLERVVQHADTVLWLPGADGSPLLGTTGEVLSRTPFAPPVVELGRTLGWQPLPLTVRDARRAAGPLRAQLPAVPARPESTTGPELARLTNVVAGHGRSVVLDGVSGSFSSGQITALMGRNGAGKSTLLRTLIGLHKPRSGTVSVTGPVALVPQVPGDLLYAATVAAECRDNDVDNQLPAGSTAGLLARLDPTLGAEAASERHPRDLSAGQQLALALAIVLAPGPQVLLLDEPTRGLDYAAKQRLVEVLTEVSGAGPTIVLATHDVELVAEVAHRVLLLADHELVADGPTAEIVVSSPAFAPQVAKVLAPAPWLTVTEVRAALREGTR